MIALSHNPKIVAVGEIGLDYHYDLSDRKTQRDVFARQIEIADKLKLPLTLHVREAYGDAQDILQAQKRYLNSGVLWHCYGGSAEFARQFAKQGHYFAFGGAITFKNAKRKKRCLPFPSSRYFRKRTVPTWRRYRCAAPSIPPSTSDTSCKSWRKYGKLPLRMRKI